MTIETENVGRSSKSRLRPLFAVLGLVVAFAVTILVLTGDVERIKHLVFSYSPPPVSGWNSHELSDIGLVLKMPRSTGGPGEEAFRKRPPASQFNVSQYGDRLYLAVVSELPSDLNDLDLSDWNDCGFVYANITSSRGSSPRGQYLGESELFEIKGVLEQRAVYGFDFSAREGPYHIHGRTIFFGTKALDMQFWTPKSGDRDEAEKFLTSVKAIP